MYQTRMMGYYPKAIQSILEFQAIVDSEYPEFDVIGDSRERIIEDAYLLTMSEERIAQWEQILGIRSVEGSTIEDRRETIVARIRGQGKLNTAVIKSIVKTFTGSDCSACVKDGTLYIRLRPAKSGKTYQLDNIVQEIKLKLPAHLGCDVSKAWTYWTNVNSNSANWGVVRAMYSNWENVLFDDQSKPNQLDYSTLDSLYLG